MPRKSNEPGATANHVAENVKRLRGERGMSKTELSRRLAELPKPRPMSLDVIAKLEAGTRAADVDDLGALADVFGVRPGSLLLAEGDESVTDEIMEFVADRVHVRPYVVEVYGFTERPDSIAIYSGEKALEIRREAGAGDG